MNRVPLSEDVADKSNCSELRDKVALITGAGSGVGRAIAEVFAKEGIKVVLCGRRAEKLNETAQSIQMTKGDCVVLPGDISSPDQVKQVVQKSLAHYGRIDILYNNAGSFQCIGGLWEVEVDAWWKDVTTNFRGPMLMMNAILPHMMDRDSGIIINMSGGGSTTALPGGSGYGSSKTALLRLTESTARELERVGSRVFVVNMGPGTVRTEMTQFQVDSEMGRKWIPSTAECFETNDLVEPTLCAYRSLDLIQHMRPSFNGRSFGTGMPIQDVARTLDANPGSEARLLRMA